MINYDSLSKKDITKRVIDSIPDGRGLYYYDESNIDKIVFDWWFTPSSPSLRLTDKGENAFRLADIEYYEFDWPAHWKFSMLNILLKLGQRIRCPYYISTFKKIRVYDNNIAIMMKLHGGVFEYITSQD